MECDQKYLSFSNRFGMLMPSSDTYFMEVSAHVSPKVATKSSFREKIIENLIFLKLFFQRKNGEVRPERLECLINLALLYLAQLHILWKWVHAFH